MLTLGKSGFREPRIRLYGIPVSSREVGNARAGCCAARLCPVSDPGRLFTWMQVFYRREETTRQAPARLSRNSSLRCNDGFFVLSALPR